MTFDPIGLKTMIIFSDRNFHHVASINDFKPTIGHVGCINGKEDGKMLDHLDMRVGDGVNMRCKSTYLKFVRACQV